MKQDREITENRFLEEDVDRLPPDYGKPISEEQRKWMNTTGRRFGKRQPQEQPPVLQEKRNPEPAVIENVQELTQQKPEIRKSAEQTIDKKTTEKKVKQKTKKKRHGRVLLTVLFLCMLFAGAAYGGVRYYVAKMNYLPFETAYVSAPDVYREKGVQNILLIGTDERHSGDTERSDSMIILSLNPKKRRIVLTSILRDSYVEIPGHGQSRLNAAYQFGGAALLIQTIEENFKIGIDSYAKVDFYSFVDIVDAVGGVDIDVDEGELVYVNGYLNEINALLGAPEGDSYLPGAGMQRLNGKQALSYARIRYIGTDFQRTDRQREILQGIVSSAKSIKPSALLHLLDGVLPQITTNISEHRMTMLILESILYMGFEMKQNRVPMDGTWWDELVNGQEVLGIDFETNRKGIRECIYQ